MTGQVVSNRVGGTPKSEKAKTVPCGGPPSGVRKRAKEGGALDRERARESHASIAMDCSQRAIAAWVYRSHVTSGTAAFCIDQPTRSQALALGRVETSLYHLCRWA